jgi:acyl-CoA thioesterase YciA
MELIGVHPIKHSDLGFNNTLFGGKLLYWIDGDAVAYAMEVCDTPRMVTITMDKCVWKKPAGPSHIIKIYAEVAEFGSSSVTLNVEARRHNVYNGKQQVVLSTHIKFVRVDEDGESVPISERVKEKYTKRKSKGDE